MSTQWKPGDVAMVEWPRGQWRPAVMLFSRWGFVRHARGEVDQHWQIIGPGNLWLKESNVLDARPLVVIDPEANPHAQGTAAWIDWIEDQYLTQSRPKPEEPEPLGLGAVVRDSRDRTWVRYLRPGTSAPWLWSEAPPECERLSVWSAIDAVEVLSEGWSE